MIAVKTFFENIDSFSKVIWLLQTWDLPSLQFDIWEKRCQRKSKALKSKIDSNPVLKIIWTIGGKKLFRAVNILTKFIDDLFEIVTYKPSLVFVKKKHSDHA